MNKREHLARVAAIGCLICGRPAEIHHLRSGMGMGQRNGNDNVIPLCCWHHRHGPFGEAIHAGAREFARRHGREDELLEMVNQILSGEK